MTQSVTVTGTIIDGPLHTPPAVRREAATSFMVACEQGAGPVVVEVHGLDAESARHLHRGDRVAVNGAIASGADGSAHTVIANRVALITNQKPAMSTAASQLSSLARQKGATARAVFERNLDSAQPTNQIDAPHR